jgi:hypothetical protein
VDGWSVVHVMVAVVDVTVLATAEITGGTDVVTKLELVDVEDAFEAFAEVTSKSYVVPGVRPVSVTECAVASPVAVPVEP